MSKEILLPVKVGGIEFKNPFFVASGPTTKSVKQLKRIEETGWAAASIKLTIDPAPYVNRVPRYAIFNDRNALCFTAEKRLCFEDGLKLVEEAKKELSELLLMANITYAGEAGPEGWLNMAKKFEEVGADIIELNMCCPNMSYNLELTKGDSEASAIKTGASLGQQASAVAEVVSLIKKHVKIPLFVKLTPEGGRIAPIAKELYAAGADAVGGTSNRLGIPPIDLDNPGAAAYHLQEEISMSCHAGAWLKPLAQRDCYEIRKVCGPEHKIMQAGGIRNYEDALQMVMCGADLLGICAETLISGYDIIHPMTAKMKEWLDSKGHKSLSDIRDAIVPEVKTALELTLYKGHAKIKEPSLSAPCKSACPMHVPAQAYIKKAAEGKIEEAYKLIMGAGPLQSVCSVVCNHRCEEACTRGENDAPVDIRGIKKFVLDEGKKRGLSFKPEQKPKNGKKAAVVGSGPAGLSCAYHLALEGFEVSVFEKKPELGGLLTYGLPDWRLPREALEGEIQGIRDLGVNFIVNKEISSPESLLSEGFDKVFWGTGAPKSRSLGLENEDADGVYGVLEFLEAYNTGKALPVGKTAVILGGGFSAVDAARTAKRLGAEKVYIAYRRTAAEMPATGEEIAEAEAEGIKIMYLVSPIGINASGGKLTGVILQNQVLSTETDGGRRKPETVEGASFEIPCDSLIAAIGQSSVKIESNPDIFVGGDAFEVDSIIAAAAGGKNAALAMAGKPVISELPTVEKENVFARSGYIKKEYTLEDMMAEASRCLSCGCGEGCQTCLSICCDFAISVKDTDTIEIDKDICVACGMCMNRCPNKNIEMVNLGETV